MDPFLAEMRIFPYGFLVPRNWALCNGQLMPISQNTALFALLGTMYGGDGKSTFALPDLMGRGPLGYGDAAALSDRVIGEMGGSETVTLLVSEMPAHTHTLRATTTPADVSSPTSTTALARSTGRPAYRPAAGATPVMMAPTALSPTGGDVPHNNLMPFLTFSICIALVGIFPQRS